MNLIKLHKDHFRTLYDVSLITDTWSKKTFEEFATQFSASMGWSVVHKGDIIGYIVLMNHNPYMDVHIHCSVLPEYQSKWMTKGIYKQVFNYIFEELWLPRCTSWIIKGYSNPTFLSRLGFKKEGTMRNGYIIGEKWCDVDYYGMLPDERRWK